jgi:hypothetical protein
LCCARYKEWNPGNKPAEDFSIEPAGLVLKRQAIGVRHSYDSEDRVAVVPGAVRDLGGSIPPFLSIPQDLSPERFSQSIFEGAEP